MDYFKIFAKRSIRLLKFDEKRDGDVDVPVDPTAFS